MRVSAVFNRLALSLITLVRASTSMSLVQPSNTVNAVKQPNLYTIRLAKVEDIPYIDKCNVENLPENYDYVFFKNHITKWPDLSLVAVDQNEDLVGYTLGKAELMQLRPSSFPGRNALFALENNAQQQQGQGSLNEEPAYQGHVTSIAVYMSHRKHGIAKKLMNTLHTNMANTYKIDTVNLHCRVGESVRYLFLQFLCSFVMISACLSSYFFILFHFRQCSCDKIILRTFQVPMCITD